MSEPNFSTPAGWTLDNSRGVPTIAGPEGDLHITFVELAPQADIQATALAAWRIIDPGFSSKVTREAAVPTQGSWESSHQVVYETPAAESRIELAMLRQLAGRAYVNLVRGSLAAVSRRGAQLSEAVTSWKPEGYKETDLSAAVAAPWDDARSAALSDFVRSAMATMQIPGVSIAIVHGGNTVWTGAFGVRALGETVPVTPQTRFMIGSTTKPLTTLLMARLVDQGKLSWSTPVRELLPDFTLADADMTERLEIRHTASASTGMPRQDAEFVFQYSGVTPEQRIAQMKTMRPTTGFGETFQYSNFLVAAGGYAAARAFSAGSSLEKAFDAAIAQLVFAPLQMHDSFIRQQDAIAGDAALPHAMDFEGAMSRIPLHIELALASVAPAGAAWSTAPDMARYLMLELAKGRLPGGEPMISEEALLERRKPGIKIDKDSSYGLGLFISNDEGLRIIHHGGNVFGFSTDMFFLPDHGFGAIILCNAFQANLFLGGVHQKIMQLVFGAEPKGEKTIATSAKLIQEGVDALAKKVTVDPAETEWVGELTGSYSCRELGPAAISRRADGYWIAFADWESPLGAEIQPAGDRLIRCLAPPWRGNIRLIVAPDGQSLTYDQGQQKYVFLKSAGA